MIRSWHTPPGVRPDGTVDADALRAWVTEARRLLAESRRTVPGDISIGGILAYVPPDNDGMWPAEPVRDLIEDLRSEHIETGLRTGKLNSRGMVWSSPTGGGAQERDLAAQFRAWAEHAADGWHRTAALLRQLADHYDEWARREDDRSRTSGSRSLTRSHGWVEVPSNEVTVLNADSWLARPQELAQILAHAWAGQVIPDPRGGGPVPNRVAAITHPTYWSGESRSLGAPRPCPTVLSRDLIARVAEECGPDRRRVAQVELQRQQLCGRRAQHSGDRRRPSLQRPRRPRSRLHARGVERLASWCPRRAVRPVLTRLPSLRPWRESLLR